jgi:methyl-accepting chemotaxis protein
MNAFSENHSISSKLTLAFAFLLLLAELMLACVDWLFKPTSWMIWFAAAVSVALLLTLIFNRFFLSGIRHMGELVAIVAALGRGDFTAKISWAKPVQASANAILSEKTHQLAQNFSRNFKGEFSLHPESQVKVGNIFVPALHCGQAALNLETSIVDRFSMESGGVATIFAMRGNDFVRVATSLKKPDGTRVIGTMLDSTQTVYQKLRRGESFAGTAQLFGKVYMTRYEPLVSAAGQVIGALFVGLELVQAGASGDEILALARGINTLTTEFGNFIAGLTKASEAVSSAANELALNTEKVANSSRRQSEATATTAAAVEQITVSISHVADHARSTETISVKTSDLSENGERIVQEASGEIARIAESVNALSQVIATLGVHSTEINTIVQVIKKVADQTNLLALNAAIEAARAGEQGRGFAVVADEVRKLAENTGDATMRISAMIDSIQHKIDDAMVSMNESQAQVQSGVVLAARARDSLGNIRNETLHTLEMVSEISSAAKEQSIASNEIASNIETIALMTDENTSVITNLAGAAVNLERMSSNLQNMVNRFRW